MEKNIDKNVENENYNDIKDKIMTSDFSLSDLIDIAENEVDEDDN